MRDVILPNADGFVPFPKVPRLFRDVIVTEKIDGTNASVIVSEDGSIKAASRNRVLRVGEQDNFGFRAWVDSNATALAEFLGPGQHFGEWWGKGIGRGYGIDERRFSLFNTQRWEGMDYKLDGRLRVVPTLFVGRFDLQDVEVATYELRTKGSRAEPGYMNPEGIILFHTAGSGSLFKFTLDGDAMKGTNNAAQVL